MKLESVMGGSYRYGMRKEKRVRVRNYVPHSIKQGLCSDCGDKFLKQGKGKYCVLCRDYRIRYKKQRNI